MEEGGCLGRPARGHAQANTPGQRGPRGSWGGPHWGLRADQTTDSAARHLQHPEGRLPQPAKDSTLPRHTAGQLSQPCRLAP